MLIIRASLRELKTQALLALWIVDQEFEAVGCQEVYVTSFWRMYGEGSLHTYGFAADVDSPQMPEDWNDSKWQSLVVRVKDRLGVVVGGPDEFDVLAHGPKAHLHFEWDPRKKPIDAVNV